jgi:hypothetical protein
MTNVTITNLNAGETYYFVATTVDTNGNQSTFSNEATFIVPGLLTLSQATGAGGPAVIHFPVAPSQWYEIQASTNLQDWATIGETGVATSNAWFQFTDTAAGSFRSRFYRLVLH